MEETKYSGRIAGDKRNYEWEVVLDVTLPDGYVGITQYKGANMERVLLCPSQVRALQEFLQANKASTRRLAGGRSKRTSKAASRR